MTRAVSRDPPAATEDAASVEALTRRVAKLERINAALMTHVERAMDQQGGAYTLFQTAIMLEGRVRARTEELTALMHNLERTNRALVSAKEDAETANRSKTRFLAAASHDLLQPLNAARLSLSALFDLAPGAEAQAVAGQVERGLQTIEDLIKTLIDISKLDAGIVEPAMRPVRLADLLGAIDASFRPFAERRELRLVTRCGDVAVRTDALLLQRILQNLVSNAIRYTERGGVLVAGRRRGDRLRIDVVDTGCGIAAGERGLVFEEFYRGSAETGDGEVGLGLGLSIVRRLAQTLGHGLALHSRPGRGTRVSLDLPVSPDPPLAVAGPEAQRRPPPVATTLTGARVLLVENDAAASAALQRLLRTWDAAVEAFRDPAGVAAATAMARPDVMIIDYHLDHGACGLDVVDDLRRTRGWVTPVVVTTADYDAAIARHVAEIGAELVHKPIKPAELRALLAYLLA